MFAPLYKCSQHGDVWQVETVDIIDSEYDDVYPITVCSQCGKEVFPIIEEGKPVCHVLTEEEMFWEQVCNFQNSNEDFYNYNKPIFPEEY